MATGDKYKYTYPEEQIQFYTGCKYNDNLSCCAFLTSVMAVAEYFGKLANVGTLIQYHWDKISGM